MIHEKKNAVHCAKILTVKNHTKLTANMAPHCDTVDGPVVVAARKALDTSNVNLVLPWVSEEDEAELKAAFDKVIAARKADSTPSLTNIIDLWFFETAMRLHRKGEGAPYTGLGPAGVDEGPIIPMAERALETRNPDELTQLLLDATEERLRRKFEASVAWQGYDVNDVTAARRCVHNMLDFVLFAHNLCHFVEGRELGVTKSDKKHLEEGGSARTPPLGSKRVISREEFPYFRCYKLFIGQIFLDIPCQVSNCKDSHSFLIACVLNQEVSQLFLRHYPCGILDGGVLSN